MLFRDLYFVPFVEEPEDTPQVRSRSLFEPEDTVEAPAVKQEAALTEEPVEELEHGEEFDFDVDAPHPPPQPSAWASPGHSQQYGSSEIDPEAVSISTCELASVLTRFCTAIRHLCLDRHGNDNFAVEF